MSKENFKLFARNHPEFVNYINNGKTSWQKLYELYDIYGENSNVWDKYFTPLKKDVNTINAPTSFSDIIKTLKHVDLNSVQKGIENVQKTIGLIEGLGLGAASKEIKNNYEPRPMYKYFED